jgi:hypothetical protein
MSAIETARLDESRRIQKEQDAAFAQASMQDKQTAQRKATELNQLEELDCCCERAGKVMAGIQERLRSARIDPAVRRALAARSAGGVQVIRRMEYEGRQLQARLEEHSDWLAGKTAGHNDGLSAQVQAAGVAETDARLLGERLDGILNE